MADGVELRVRGDDCAVRSALRRRGFRGFNVYAAHVIPEPQSRTVCQ